MANVTEINKNIKSGSNATMINRNVNPSNGNATVINRSVSGTHISVGTVLCEKYVVKEKMQVKSGEADLYICEHGNKKYVAKVYRREMSIKPDVIAKLKNISSPYVAPICDMGEWNGTTVEVMPYYPIGSLQGKKLELDQLKNVIIPCLNNGLKAMHDNGIIHKDLKPSNIMITEGGKSIAIIDFGISSAVESGSTVIVTRTGMTPQYSAPETFRDLFLSESDYYSMGITIYELYCGKTPYDNMPQEEIEKYVSVQRIPFPSNMPQELKELIIALTYYDITNRKNKENPNRRWGYDEVKKWCSGIKQTIPGEGIDRKEIPPFEFKGKKYIKREELVRALVENWDDGKKQLFRGNFSQYFGRFDKPAENICRKAEMDATRQSGKDDMIFWSTMYALNPKTTEFYWKGRVYQSLPALGRDLLEHLWKDDKSLNSYVTEIFNNSIFSAYVRQFDAKNTQMLKAVESLESSFRAYTSGRDRRINLYMTGYMLSGQKLMHIGDKDFRTVGELNEFMKKMVDESFDDFQELCHSLVDYDGNLDCQFESWLVALGKRKEIEQWKQKVLN